MVTSLDLEELFEFKQKGFRLFVEVEIRHNITDFRGQERCVNRGEIGELVKIEEDEMQQELLRGAWVSPFLGASKYRYEVDFGDIVNEYTSSYLQDPGYAMPRESDPLKIEDFFFIKEKISPKNHNQLNLF